MDAYQVQLAALRRYEEAYAEALKVRAEGHRKIAKGNQLLGKAIEISDHPSRQSAGFHSEGHKLIAQGHEMAAKCDEAVAFATLGRQKALEDLLQAVSQTWDPPSAQAVAAVVPTEPKS